jgi:hypothetical protein
MTWYCRMLDVDIESDDDDDDEDYDCYYHSDE